MIDFSQSDFAAWQAEREANLAEIRQLTRTLDAYRKSLKLCEAESRKDAAVIERFTAMVCERDKANVELVQYNTHLREELVTWRSVFPDIAPASVQPDRSLLEAENARMRHALQQIVDMQPDPEFGAVPIQAAQAVAAAALGDQ